MARKKTSIPPVRRVIGEYNGSDIVGVAVKLAGNATGLSDAMTIDGYRPRLGERVALLIIGHTKNVGYSDDKTDPDSDDCIEIGTISIAEGGFVSRDIAETMMRAENERRAQARAQLEGEQGSILEGGDPSLTVVELEHLSQKLDAAGLPKMSDDRFAYYERVLGEKPSVLRQSHLELIEADLAEGDRVIADEAGE